MFTGIIEELGVIERITSSSNSMELTVGTRFILDDVKLGDSIAVNGVCLTVTDFGASRFKVDVMPETFEATSLSQLKLGEKVNLERAMIANGRFGGHIVSGHIDGLAKITRKEVVSNAVYIDLQMDAAMLNYCINKCSITVDGTSLTIFKVSTTTVTVSLIPHTYSHTVLGLKRIGQLVNIELDLMSKYVEKHLQTLLNQKQSRSHETTITLEHLQRAGF